MAAIPDTTFILAVFDKIGDPVIFELVLAADGMAVPLYIIKHELQRGEASREVPRLAAEKRIRTLETVGEDEVKDFMEEHLGVDRGESHAILGCQRLGGARGGAYCILDDLEARKVATDLGIPYTGTIGKITDLRRRGMAEREQALDWPDGLQGSDFRATDELFDDARREVSGPRPWGRRAQFL